MKVNDIPLALTEHVKLMWQR